MRSNDVFRSKNIIQSSNTFFIKYLTFKITKNFYVFFITNKPNNPEIGKNIIFNYKIKQWVCII